MPSLLGCYFVLVSPKTCHRYVLGQQTPAMLSVCCFASIQVGGLPDRMKMEVIEPLRPTDFLQQNSVLLQSLTRVPGCRFIL